VATALVTGGTGLLAPYVAEAAGTLGTVVVSSRTGSDRAADLSRSADVESLFDSVRPDVVFHTAALTDVDLCERDPAAARLLNQEVVANLVQFLRPSTVLVLFSTDQVYPDTRGLHREGDEAPVNTYGRTKLGGESEALAHDRSLIVRTNLFGPSRTAGRESLSDFVIGRLRGGDEAGLFTDVSFNPLHMETLAKMTVQVVEAGLTGVFNLGSRDGMTKHDFGVAVGRHLGLDVSLIRRTRSDDLAGRAPRPHDLRTAVDRLESALGIVMPTLQEEVLKL